MELTQVTTPPQRKVGSKGKDRINLILVLIKPAPSISEELSKKRGGKRERIGLLHCLVGLAWGKGTGNTKRTECEGTGGGTWVIAINSGGRKGEISKLWREGGMHPGTRSIL